MSNFDGLTLYKTEVPVEWVDYNQHMNDACYGIAFSKASDEFIDYIGMDEEYRTKTGYSIYTLETHICFLNEAKLGDPLSVVVRLVAKDEKRFRLFMNLYNDSDNTLLATQEALYIHVDTQESKVIHFEEDIQQKVDQIWDEHAQFPKPEQAGRTFKKLKNDILLTEK